MAPTRSKPAVFVAILVGLLAIGVVPIWYFFFREPPQPSQPDEPVAVDTTDGNDPISDADGADSVPDDGADEPSESAIEIGSFFSPAPADPYRPPQVVELWTPSLEEGAAIWGATGRDHRGHIWYGVSTGQSAKLFELDPETNESFARGDVLAALNAIGLDAVGLSQSKIHTPIVQADDGYLYFASMDEHGEAADGSRLPNYGSHIWRLKPDDPSWEHVQAIPEALIAMSGGRRWIYALGYFDHVLYQVDTRTGDVRSVRIGSVGGHRSRRFLADQRGHAFVPRLVAGDDDSFAATLVELDATLRELGETPLEHYYSGDPLTDKAHGITGVVTMADGSMVFTTHLGFLYQIVPDEDGPAEVRPLGWFHPEGAAEAESLFTYAGERYLVGVARRPGSPYQWLIYDLKSRESRALEFRLIDLVTPPGKNLLLSGSLTRDSSGRFYVVGCYHRKRLRPLIVQVDAQ